MTRTMVIPGDLRYAKTHEWVKIEGHVATVGISAFAVSQINEVIFVELPQPGKVVGHETPLGSIESVKAVFDLFSPVDGSVIEVNSGLNDHPEIIAQDPYGAGWIAKLTMAESQDLGSLLDAKAYEAHIAATHT